MLRLEEIRAQIKHLYQTNPIIHMDVSLVSPRLSLHNAEAKITGVYPHIFQIEEYSSGFPKRHTLQYTDVLIKQITILELPENRE